MPKAYESWTVLPHRPIEKVSESLWRVEGDLPNMPLKRVMTVAKRADGRLVVHNGIGLDEASMKEIDAWGEVAFVLVPNGYHRLDARTYHDRYPKAQVLAPFGAKAKVAEVTEVHGSFDDFPPDDVVSLETLDGTNQAEGAMVVRDASGTTLVLNDAVFNMPHVPGVQGFFLKHLTGSTGGPRVSRIGKLFVLKDKAAFRAHLERLADLPDLRRVVVSHHETITSDPAGTLRSVAAAI